MKPMNVCVVTGTRAEFGIWRPVLRAIEKSAALKLQLVVTGMHLQNEFGATEKQIAEEGFKAAARVPMYRAKEPAAKSLARGVEGLAAAYRALKPGVAMVLGDRLEMLAAASAALAERIPIAHVHGGESAPGIWDEQIRHAITKMAQLHFCATEMARRRIVRMGENPESVHRVGAPALDEATEAMRAWRRVIPKLRLVVGTSPLLLLHPSTPDDALEYERTRMLIDLLRDAFYEPMIHAIGSNNDPGYRGILRAYSERRNCVHVEMSLSQSTFWLRMISSGLLVGNSSSGIIEAATLGVPVVNIGERQAGRERNVNVIDVGWDARSIEAGLRKAVSDQAFLKRVARRKNMYGDGNAAKRIVAVLERVAQSGGLPLAKRFVD